VGHVAASCPHTNPTTNSCPAHIQPFAGDVDEALVIDFTNVSKQVK